MARQFHFVTVSNPTHALSSKSRKSAYSHAFRQAHAQRRLKQVETHRQETATVPTINTVCVAPEEGISSLLSRVPLDSNKDPFSSLARPLSSAEYFLLNHYVHVIVPFTIGHCGLFDRPGDHKTQLLREWVGLAIADDTLMAAAILLSTCRYLLRLQPHNLMVAQLALEYKQTSLRAIRQDMTSASGPVTAMTVAKALALALDEVMAGEHSIARKHLRGILAMVDSGGGVGELGLTGLLERMYCKFMRIFELEGQPYY